MKGLSTIKTIWALLWSLVVCLGIAGLGFYPFVVSTQPGQLPSRSGR